MKEVWVVLTDRFADWEAAYAVAYLNQAPGIVVRTVAEDASPKASMGGLRTEIDLVIDDTMDLSNLYLLILPGGMDWKGKRHEPIAALVRRVHEADIPVAAICGATQFLARHGFLDNIRHTGDALSYFTEEEGYNGKHLHVDAQVMADGGFITANETAAVDFAYLLFRILRIAEDADLDKWRDDFVFGQVRK